MHLAIETPTYITQIVNYQNVKQSSMPTTKKILYETKKSAIISKRVFEEYLCLWNIICQWMNENQEMLFWSEIGHIEIALKIESNFKQ